MEKWKVRIANSKPMLLIGIRTNMSFSRFSVARLWNKFMQRRSEVNNKLDENLISLAIYKTTFFESFSPDTEFEKWAAVKVSSGESIPEDMESLFVPGGLYAVIDYQGNSNDASVFQYMFTQWIPHSEYELDDRPHFEILGQDYASNDPNSKEEIWIPVRIRNT